MADFDFFTWFYSKENPGFWQRYTQKYLGTVQKGSWSKAYEVAEREMKKAIKAKQPPDQPQINTAEDFAKVCDLALHDQKLFHDEAKRQGEFAANFCAPMRWFSHRKWEQQIGSHIELKKKTKSMHKAREKPKLGKIIDQKKVEEHRKKLKEQLGLRKQLYGK